MKLGYLGPNTNSEIAARKYAADIAGLEIKSYPAMSQVFSALDSGKVERALIPVKNSITGDIEYKKTAEESRFTIIDEISIKIRHYLASKEKNIRFIVSHEQVLRQCAEYLDCKYPFLSRIKVESTNEAAKLASMGLNFGAIACLDACRSYKLEIIAEDIIKNNFSTFWVLR